MSRFLEQFLPSSHHSPGFAHSIITIKLADIYKERTPCVKSGSKLPTRKMMVYTHVLNRGGRPTDNRLPSWSGILRFRRPVYEGSSVFQKKFDKELKTEENPFAL